MCMVGSTLLALASFPGLPWGGGGGGGGGVGGKAVHTVRTCAEFS